MLSATSATALKACHKPTKNLRATLQSRLAHTAAARLYRDSRCTSASDCLCRSAQQRAEDRAGAHGGRGAVDVPIATQSLPTRWSASSSLRMGSRIRPARNRRTGIKVGVRGGNSVCGLGRDFGRDPRQQRLRDPVPMWCSAPRPRDAMPRAATAGQSSRRTPDRVRS